MNTNLVYEAVDLRQTALPLEPIVRLVTIPGGLRVWGIGGRSQDLPYDDENAEAFIDDEAAGVVEVRTDAGRVVFEKLRRANFESELSPFWDTPEFKTDEEVQAYFWNKLEEAAR